MIRRNFLLILGQISVFAFVFKGQAQEPLTIPSDLAPTADPKAAIQFQQLNSLSSAPLASGPLCGPSLVRFPSE